MKEHNHYIMYIKQSFLLLSSPKNLNGYLSAYPTFTKSHSFEPNLMKILHSTLDQKQV